jgi:hypothetical protein
MSILQVLELPTNEEAVAALPYGTEEVVLERLLYIFLLITGIDMLSYYGWSNTPGRISLNGLLMG